MAYPYHACADMAVEIVFRLADDMTEYGIFIFFRDKTVGDGKEVGGDGVVAVPCIRRTVTLAEELPVVSLLDFGGQCPVSLDVGLMP